MMEPFNFEHKFQFCEQTYVDLNTVFKKRKQVFKVLIMSTCSCDNVVLKIHDSSRNFYAVIV